MDATAHQRRPNGFWGVPASCAVMLPLLLSACGESHRSDHGWYRPSADASWQIQLLTDGSHPLNTGYAVELYDVDLVDTSVDQITALHAAGRKVVCYFSTAYEDWRPDAADFPATVIGSAMGGWPGENWVDIRAPAVLDIMEARMDLAVAKGCDGVDPDNVHAYEIDADTTDGEATGFGLTAADQLAFNRALAAAGHQRGLAVGLKNDITQAAVLVDDFDFSINEQCHYYNECSYLDPFVAAGKPVLHLEYDASYVADPSALCAWSRAHDHRTLVMALALDDTYRYSCD